MTNAYHYPITGNSNDDQERVRNKVREFTQDKQHWDTIARSKGGTTSAGPDFPAWAGSPAQQKFAREKALKRTQK